MDRAELLELYDRRMRRETSGDDHPDARLERDGKTVIWLGGGADDWSGVVWSRLSEGDADQVIGAAIARLREWGRPFEWKYFAHDTPADLAERLVAAGLHPDDEEAVMVGDIEELDLEVRPPEGIELRRVSAPSDVAALVRVHEEVFGSAEAWIGRMIERALVVERPPTVGVVAWAGDRPVSASRVDLHDGTEFASLWGGGTVPEWRRRGIYRAMVAFRGGVARRRGHRYLQVDALPTSRPILERLGFVQLTSTTPYLP